MLNEFVKSLRERLNELESSVKNLEEGLVGTKIEQCQALIKTGESISEQIEGEVQNLEQKLAILEANADKAGEDDRKGILKEIEKTQSLIEDTKQQREKLKREL